MRKLLIVMALVVVPAIGSAKTMESQTASATVQAASEQSGIGGTYGPPAPLPETGRVHAAADSSGAATGSKQTPTARRHIRRHGYVGAEGGVARL